MVAPNSELAVAKAAIEQAEGHLLACNVGGIIRAAEEEERFRLAKEALHAAREQCASDEVRGLLSRALDAIPKPRGESDVIRRITRFGRSVEPDAVFDAWKGRDLMQMRAALALPTNAVDRHYLLASLIGELYKLRADPAIRQELFSIGRTHLDELPSLGAAQLEDRRLQRAQNERVHAERAARRGKTPAPLPPFDDRLWHYGVGTFLLLVRAYCEIEQYDAARQTWHEAHRIGYLDAEGLAIELEGVEKRRRKNERTRLRQ